MFSILCRRGEIKYQEIKRSRDQKLYQGVGNRKIYSYFGEALKVWKPIYRRVSAKEVLFQASFSILSLMYAFII
jgi:hypothetical protein